jgi:hypothetical protein
MAVPVWALCAAELAFPLIAAWSAASLGAALRGGAPAGGEPAAAQ